MTEKDDSQACSLSSLQDDNLFGTLGKVSSLRAKFCYIIILIDM